MQAQFKDGSIIISGTVPKDAEFKNIGEKNTPLTTFGVKVGVRKNEHGEIVKDENGRPVAIWVNCQVWYEAAYSAVAIKKGDTVLCVGKIQISKGKDGKEYKNFYVEYFSIMPKSAEKPNTQSNVPFSEADVSEYFSEGEPF